MDVDLTSPVEGDHITVAIAEKVCGELRPLSVDLRTGIVNVLLSARKAQIVDEIFQPDFAAAIRGICQKVGAETQIVNDPDFRIRIHGLAIEGYTLFARKSDGGLRRFTIRLRRVTGNALALLKLGHEDTSALRRDMIEEIGGRVSADRLFDEMLAHLYLPLVNLNSYLRTVLDGQRACAEDEFSISAVQLKGRTEILQFAFDRMLSELMVARATDDEAAVPGEAPPTVAEPALAARADRPRQVGLA